MNKNILIWSHLILAAVLVLLAFYVETGFMKRGSYLTAIGIAYMVVRKSNVEDMASRGWIDDLISMLLIGVACFSIAYIFFAPRNFEMKCVAAGILTVAAFIGIRRIKIRYFSNKLEDQQS